MTDSPVQDFVDDRPADGVFRVRRAAFVEPGLFEREIERIFRRCWSYICHDSQLRERGRYVRGTIGRYPVFAIRGLDGEIRCFHDSCPHRGSMLTRGRSGVQPTITCRYHGWAFNADGRCIRVRGRDTGYSREALERLGTDLKPVPRVAAYRGFVFACLDADVEDLESFLGGARPFIDLMADQSEQGMEVLKGESTYVMRANWKLQTENSTDGYHVATVHRNFAHTVRQREALAGGNGDAREKTEASRILDLESIRSGGYDVGNGHMINWSDRGSPGSAPLNEAREAIAARFGAGKARWMIDRGRTVTVFPNFFLNDVASTCIRLWRPVAVDLTEIDTWCLAPIGESREARRARIRKYEDFFLPSSLAVPDDVRAMEVAHAGSMAAGGAAWNDLALGHATMVEGADDAARELGAEPLYSNPGRESETPFHGFWREWRRRLDRP